MRHVVLFIVYLIYNEGSTYDANAITATYGAQHVSPFQYLSCTTACRAGYPQCIAIGPYIAVTIALAAPDVFFLTYCTLTLTPSALFGATAG